MWKVFGKRKPCMDMSLNMQCLYRVDELACCYNAIVARLEEVDKKLFSMLLDSSVSDDEYKKILEEIDDIQSQKDDFDKKISEFSF